MPREFAQTRPDSPSVPPRREISSSVSGFMSQPIAPLSSTLTPRGRVSSYATVISTTPDIGGRSGHVINIRVRRSTGGIVIDSSPGSKSGSGRGGRDTLTGILRGMIDPSHISDRPSFWCGLTTQDRLQLVLRRVALIYRQIIGVHCNALRRPMAS